jgi:hypothetical protein
VIPFAAPPASPSGVSVRSVLYILLVAALTRLPFLVTGYGADGDAWRVAAVADRFWRTGQYEISRAPGYPLFELLCAPLVGSGGAPLANVATLLASLATLVVFFRLVSREASYPAGLTAVFAFTPLFWVNSTGTLDYVWSLLFLLLALRASQKQRSLIAGFCFGLAIGFRPVNAVALFPLLGMIILQKDSGNLKRRRVLAMAFAAIGTVALSFMPVFLTYGFTGWLNMIHNQLAGGAARSEDAFQLFAYRCIYAIGPPATLVTLWILFASRKRFLVRWKERDSLLIVSLLALVSFGVLFLLFPLEKGYLLPALPFLLVLLDRCATRTQLVLFAVCTVLFAFLNPDTVSHSGARGKPGLNLRAGMVIEEWQKRRELLSWRKGLAGHRFAPRTVVMTGAGPSFWFENTLTEPARNQIGRTTEDLAVRQKADTSVYYLPMLTADELLLMRSTGYQVECDEGNREYIETRVGYTMKEEGIPSYVASNP